MQGEGDSSVGEAVQQWRSPELTEKAKCGSTSSAISVPESRSRRAEGSQWTLKTQWKAKS